MDLMDLWQSDYGANTSDMRGAEESHQITKPMIVVQNLPTQKIEF